MQYESLLGVFVGHYDSSKQGSNEGSVIISIGP